jgi:hypothetical protein
MKSVLENKQTDRTEFVKGSQIQRFCREEGRAEKSSSGISRGGGTRQ